MTKLEALAREVGFELASRGLTLALAESCTGGLLGHSLTEIPGASRFLLGGATCYANAAKMKLLSVRAETLQCYGAVSLQCATEMLLGVRTLFGSDAAIAITGIAGPDGGSTEKPVGTVFIAVSINERIEMQGFLFAGERAAIKQQAACAALLQLGLLLAEK
ncbi:MAG: Nicotinamide-nucleotide amidohydrolase PncC [Firmicutes bacterium]|nr:Nicotinamide-nucleotide amidohydrolase PncC [candidate division NPL-UPA2 bacterium]